MPHYTSGGEKLLFHPIKGYYNININQPCVYGLRCRCVGVLMLGVSALNV